MSMFRTNDLILILVVFSSLAAGVLFPGPSSFFQPFPLYLMMFLLFLSFLSIRLDEVWLVLSRQGWTIAWLCFLKLAALPAGIYFLFRAVYPDYATAALLITGISTGVVAPFISSMLRANGPLVLVMVVITSCLVSFTLPALVKLLLGKSVAISFFGMMRLLGLIIFVPVIAVEIMRRTVPKAMDMLSKIRFPISLVIFAVINLGVFSKYAQFFRQKPATILEAAIVATALGAVYITVGILAAWRAPVKDRIASAVSMGNMNNVLVIVFASEFFGPIEPTLAAMYMIPFFGLIFPLRFYDRMMKKDV
jgi:BASS family bile acid:Na+ symporter